jgi:hypothetical protein
MVKPLPKKKRQNRSTLKWILLAASLSIWGLIFASLPPFIKLDENGNYILSEERLKDYKEKPSRSEQIEVYRLLATQRGLYPCLKCPGVTNVRLNSGEVWKYGISRHGKNRYPASFYLDNRLSYQTILITDILEAEQIEKN